MNWPSILLIGDSLTQYGYSESGKWVALLADEFQRKCDIMNRGFAGYTTRTLKPFLPSILTNELVANNVATVIFLGANDSNEEELNKMQHVPLKEYKENLAGIIKICRDKGMHPSKILLVPPPPCDEEMWRKELEKKEGGPVKRSPKNNETTLLYHKACVEVAKEQKCQTLTDTNEYWNTLNSSENFVDGLHFSAEGSKNLFNFVSKELREMTSELPMILPPWREIPIQSN